MRKVTFKLQNHATSDNKPHPVEWDALIERMKAAIILRLPFVVEVDKFADVVMHIEGKATDILKLPKGEEGNDKG